MGQGDRCQHGACVAAQLAGIRGGKPTDAGKHLGALPPDDRGDDDAIRYRCRARGCTAHHRGTTERLNARCQNGWEA
jgi:hypothetical protein